MKTIIAFLISIHLLNVSALCQADSASLKVMEAIFRDEQPKGTLYYVDKLNKDFITLFKDKFRNRKIIGIVEYNVFDSMLLSGKEMRLIKSGINKLYSFRWNDSLFLNSKRIPGGSMWAHISKRNKEFSAMARTLPKDQLHITNDRVTYANVFTFSYPIWLRNGSMFILFFYRMCGPECGVNELAVYRLENGVYKKWILIYGGVF